jgi:hypothetical protein
MKIGSYAWSLNFICYMGTLGGNLRLVNFFKGEFSQAQWDGISNVNFNPGYDFFVLIMAIIGRYGVFVQNSWEIY